MLRSEFYYELPQELIAQTPLEPRDSSRLMKIDRESGAVTHDRFYNLAEYLREGDLLVMNDSKVFPARIIGVKEGQGGAVCEFLLLEQHGSDTWEAIVH
ncbi:MAG: S-adenosylmethionine:tRNA ribosyltransferase-isomerase, partial [Ruminiclostridium sp.]|nr:S-adenosylmethionine:tRNA ribosyltransferase-isomerase [Ruminiclostridium sp.]